MNTPRTLYALCIATTLTASSMSLADVLTVPSREHPTLQGAIWDAENGDVVNILPGVYNGTLHVSATEGCRAVTLRAAHGPGSVVLQSWAGRHQFTGWLCGDEGIDLMHIRVEGITFAASQRFQRFKDGVHVTHCTADFINCEFTGLVNDINRDDWQPSGTDNHGAVTIHQSVATFTRCTFSNNGAVNTRGKVGTMVTGGAIDSFESDLVIDRCRFNNNYVKTTDSDNPNSASKTKALGGALRLKRGTLRIDDSTFVSNTASGLPGHRTSSRAARSTPRTSPSSPSERRPSSPTPPNVVSTTSGRPAWAVRSISPTMNAATWPGSPAMSSSRTTPASPAARCTSRAAP